MGVYINSKMSMYFDNGFDENTDYVFDGTELHREIIESVKRGCYTKKFNSSTEIFV